ncbi:MAG TPA: hypothetical protein VH541_06155 [Gaiellaceae bacterium]
MNVPTLVLPPQPTFVLRPEESSDARLERFDEFPEVAPSYELAAEARWDVLTMLMTPSCHLAEGEKDENIATVVPVVPIRSLFGDTKTIAKILEGRSYGEYLHLFPLPRTELGSGVLRLDCVALLDRPTSILKHDLRGYRRLGLYREYRVELRKKLARFWARAKAEEVLDEELRLQTDGGRPFDSFE